EAFADHDEQGRRHEAMLGIPNPRHKVAFIAGEAAERHGGRVASARSRRNIDARQWASGPARTQHARPTYDASAMRSAAVPIELLPVAVMVCSVDGTTIRKVNRMAADLLGATTDDVVGRPLA